MLRPWLAIGEVDGPQFHALSILVIAQGGPVLLQHRAGKCLDGLLEGIIELLHALEPPVGSLLQLVGDLDEFTEGAENRDF